MKQAMKRIALKHAARNFYRSPSIYYRVPLQVKTDEESWREWLDRIYKAVKYAPTKRHLDSIQRRAERRKRSKETTKNPRSKAGV